MLTLSLETENNDYNTDEVYNQNLLDDLLKQDDIDRFREEFAKEVLGGGSKHICFSSK